MSVSQESRDQVFNWMQAEVADFADSLDLAVCCASDLELLEDDNGTYNVPEWILDLAETFIPNA